jgi:hypothetical protein
VKVILGKQLVEVDEGGRQNGYLWVCDVGLGEVNHKESALNLCDVEAISIGIGRIEHVRIAKVSLVFCPTSSSHKIVAVDHVQLIHLVAALGVKGGPVEVDGSFLKFVLWVVRYVSYHHYVVYYL